MTVKTKAEDLLHKAGLTLGLSVYTGRVNPYARDAALLVVHEILQELTPQIHTFVPYYGAGGFTTSVPNDRYMFWTGVQEELRRM